MLQNGRNRLLQRVVTTRIIILVQALHEAIAIVRGAIAGMGRDSLDETAQSSIKALVALTFPRDPARDDIGLDGFGTVHVIGIVLVGAVVADVNESQQGNDAPHHRRVVEQQRLARDDVDGLARGVAVIFQNALNDLASVGIGVDQYAHPAPVEALVKLQQIGRQDG